GQSAQGKRKIRKIPDSRQCRWEGDPPIVVVHPYSIEYLIIQSENWIYSTPSEGACRFKGWPKTGCWDSKGDQVNPPSTVRATDTGAGPGISSSGAPLPRITANPTFPEGENRTWY